VTLQLYDLAGAEDQRRFSPHCWRVKMALRHKGLEADEIPWRFVEKDRIAFSGQKLVPVLVDGERTVTDSFEITRYLEHAYPDRPSLFGGSVGEALTLFVRHWVEQTVHPPLLRLILPGLLDVLHEKDRAYFRETREARFGRPLDEVAVPPEEGVPVFRKALGPVRATLERQPWLAGAQPGFADYILFGAFMWARAVSSVALLEPGDPVHGWRERLLDAFGGYARSSPGYDA
jgi:glutathione S-transferase